MMPRTDPKASNAVRGSSTTGDVFVPCCLKMEPVDVGEQKSTQSLATINKCIGFKLDLGFC